MNFVVVLALLLLALPASAADINQTSWSQTDASNTAAPPAGWPAGMAPNQVEPTARAMMGAIKRWYAHANATATSSGSANAQTLTYTVAPTALVAGDIYRFKAGFSNSGAATIKINSLDTKAVQKAGAALSGGEIAAGSYVEIVYDGTQFQLNPTSGTDVPMMPTTAAVKALIAGQFPAVTRLNHTGTDGASQLYLWSGTDCSISGGDDISQIAPTTGTGCWVLPSTQAWSKEILQNGGCFVDGLTEHRMLWSDCNTIIRADSFNLLNAQPGLVHADISGTPTINETPGISIALGTTTYEIKYTVQSGDDNTAVAVGLQNCLIDDQVAIHCTATPSSFTAALLALTPSYKTSAGNASTPGYGIDFDIPLPPATTAMLGINSAHTTVDLTPLTSVRADTGPFYATVAFNAGRTPLAGDQIGSYRFDGQSTTQLIDAQYAGMVGRIVDPTHAAPIGEGILVSANGNGLSSASAVMGWSKGVFGSADDGAGTLLPDPGWGGISFFNFYGVSGNFNVLKPKNSSILQFNSGSDGYFFNNAANSAVLYEMTNAGDATLHGSLTVTGAMIGESLVTGGHVTNGGGAASVGTGAGDCGTSPELVGNDTAGRVTVGSGSNGNKCTITFATAYSPNAPVCAVANETSINRPVYPIGTTMSELAITSGTTLTAGDSLVYHCVGIQ